MRYAWLVALTLVVATPAQALVASSDFASIIRRHRPELVRCYEASPERATEPLVRMTLQIQIGVDGHVVSASAGPSERGLGLRTCIESAARTWVFPAGREANVTISYPLVFSPG